MNRTAIMVKLLETPDDLFRTNEYKKGEVLENSIIDVGDDMLVPIGRNSVYDIATGEVRNPELYSSTMTNEYYMLEY